MKAGHLGFLDTPRQGNIRPAGVAWAADNGCFGKGWPGYTAWLDWLDRHAHAAPYALFATAPDVVADAQATLDRSGPYLDQIRAKGYPAALVAQDGLEDLQVPWSTFDVLFIGGSTEWKLGPAARALIVKAQHEGKKVHMGRVNSLKRLRYAASLGCDSVDGTYLTFGPSVNLPRLLRWLGMVHDELSDTSHRITP